MIAIGSGFGNSATASGLIDYARSGDGAAIVLKSGLIPRKGLFADVAAKKKVTRK
jgi:hypothetical protein